MTAYGLGALKGARHRERDEVGTRLQLQLPLNSSERTVMEIVLEWPAIVTSISEVGRRVFLNITLSIDSDDCG